MRGAFAVDSAEAAGKVGGGGGSAASIDGAGSVDGGGGGGTVATTDVTFEIQAQSHVLMRESLAYS